MIEAVKEKKKPVRPHWMERYKEAEKEIERLRVALAELGRVAARESAMLNEKYSNVRGEIDFLRGIITELAATLRRVVKAQDG